MLFRKKLISNPPLHPKRIPLIPEGSTFETQYYLIASPKEMEGALINNKPNYE